MSPGRWPHDRRWPLLLAAVAFGLACTQAPLYYSNQNQYFLHGLAQAGRGYLADDWLAGTADPTPLFSTLVAFTARWVGDQAFHLYYLLIQGLYALSLLGIWTATSAPRPGPVQQFAFLAGLTLVHSALARWLSCQLLGVDYPWYFQAGLAGQYLLGSMFQPSVFGVLLLLSIGLFLHDRPYGAAVAASLAGVVHATYFLAAAVLVLTYVVLLSLPPRAGRWRTGLAAGLLALAVAAPAVWFTLQRFGPTTPEMASQARAILVHFRIPHHARIDRWLDGVAILQVLWVATALLQVRRTRLAAIMLASLLVGLGLTLGQWLSGSDALALLFPWRVSTYLVPLATAIMVGKLVLVLVPPREARVGEGDAAAVADAGQRPGLPWVAAGLVLAACAAAGIVIMERRLGYLRHDAELPVYEHVRAHLKKGQTYLVPYKLPRPPAAPGSSSNDFLLEDDGTGRRIPLEMQRFRLHSGAPILVDFKAIPYRDAEVLEWRARLDDGLHIYRSLEAGRYDLAREAVEKYRLTHIVSLRPLPVEQLEAVYEDDHYRIYRIRPAKGGD